ncbi:FecR family protein [Chitinophaga japonensis]|uniref:FecR family protein n=1 Tax=Chitinophaga japonensis TaxID=104662 RepID=A0A562TC43_CHIJA|nr:FecR family protein [Chitinophaga japonensis]TWI91121.1 FecR family protein [Chitinophaga japonensis]
MDRSTLLYLLEKFRQGACTEAERQLLHQWLDRLEQDAAEDLSLPDDEKQRLRNDMLHNILTIPAAAPQRPRLIIRRWMKAAAVLLPLLGAACLLYLQYRQPAPAATWQTRHNHTAAVQRILLPDSSLAILGAHTSVQYTTADTGATRLVRLLKGKAFFETRTDPQRPFIVESNGIRTTVLGTSFSVAAYEGLYACRVTVMTGKVQVHTNAGNYGVLTRAQRITIPAGTAKLLRDTVAVADALAWTKGEIVLRHASLQELMQMLREQYGITAHTRLNAAEGDYTLRLQASMPLQEVLDVIEKISYKPKIRFTMERNRLLIY